MRLNEQRDHLMNEIAQASSNLKFMRSAILRKMASPYGDGSRSNMVNAESDVLPQLEAVLDILRDAVEVVGYDVVRKLYAAGLEKKQAEAVRIW